MSGPRSGNGAQCLTRDSRSSRREAPLRAPEHCVSRSRGTLSRGRMVRIDHRATTRIPQLYETTIVLVKVSPPYTDAVSMTRTGRFLAFARYALPSWVSLMTTTSDRPF